MAGWRICGKDGRVYICVAGSVLGEMWASKQEEKREEKRGRGGRGGVRGL